VIFVDFDVEYLLDDASLPNIADEPENQPVRNP